MLNIAVVGTGYWGKNHVKTFAALRDEGLDISITVCDINEKRARKLAEEYGATWVSNTLELIKGEKAVHAVTIATPSPMHADQAEFFLKNGIPIMVEKPLALTISKAKAVIELSKSTGTLLSVGHVFRHHAAIREASKMIQQGKLGPIKLIESIRTAVREPRPDMGAIHALAIHDYDIFSFLLNNQIPEVINSSIVPSNIPGIEDHAITHLTFNGEGGSIILGCSIVGWRSRIEGKQRKLRIFGRDASLDIDYLDHSGLWIHHHPNEAVGPEWGGSGAAPRERWMIPIGEPALTAELRHFLQLVLKGKKNDIITGGNVGLNGVIMVERALKSSKLKIN